MLLFRAVIRVFLRLDVLVAFHRVTAAEVFRHEAALIHRKHSPVRAGPILEAPSLFRCGTNLTGYAHHNPGANHLLREFAVLCGSVARRFARRTSRAG